MKKILAALALTAVASPAWASTITGTLHSVCNYAPVVGGGCGPSITLSNGISYAIQTDKFFGNGELVPLNGATVKLTGKLFNPPKGGAAQFRPTFAPSTARVSVKGQLNELYFDAIQSTIPTFPHVGNMNLEWQDNGSPKSILVDTGNQNFLKYNHKDVWVTGNMVKGGGGDMPSYLSATLVNGHKGAFMAQPGSAVALGSATTPGAASTEKDGSAGGGVTR